MDNDNLFDNPVEEQPVLNVDIHCIVAPDEEQQKKIAEFVRGKYGI